MLFPTPQTGAWSARRPTCWRAAPAPPARASTAGILTRTNSAAPSATVSAAAGRSLGRAGAGEAPPEPRPRPAPTDTAGRRCLRRAAGYGLKGNRCIECAIENCGECYKDASVCDSCGEAACTPLGGACLHGGRWQGGGSACVWPCWLTTAPAPRLPQATVTVPTAKAAAPLALWSRATLALRTSKPATTVVRQPAACWGAGPPSCMPA